jgi:hypothetical protein
MQLGLADWTAALLNWLERFDGLEAHLDESDCDPARLDPACCVRNVLLTHVAFWPGLKPTERLTPAQRNERLAAIIDDLLELEFIGTVSEWCGRKRFWNPLNENWLSFVTLGPDPQTLCEIESCNEVEGLLDTWISPEAARKRQSAFRQMLTGEPAGERT